MPVLTSSCRLLSCHWRSAFLLKIAVVCPFVTSLLANGGRLSYCDRVKNWSGEVHASVSRFSALFVHDIVEEADKAPVHPSGRLPQDLSGG